MKYILDLNASELRFLKCRYIDMLQGEGSLNEVLFDKPELDECEGYRINDYGEDRLVAMIPDDLIFKRHEGECFDEEDFAS